MELTTIETPARVTKTLNPTVALAAGASVKAELGSEAENELATEVPAGKQWLVQLGLHISETDA